VFCGRERISESDAKIESVGELGPFILHLTVDTSGAGFRTRPCYFARLEGPGVVLTGVGDDRYLVDGFTSLSIPETHQLTRFELTFVGFVFGLQGNEPKVETAGETVLQKWQVEWIGFEG
jgi:hypothetical protein